MIKDRLRAWLSKSGGRAEPPGHRAPPPAPDNRRAVRPRPLDQEPGGHSTSQPKHSHGLAQFVSSVRDQSGLSILDLGEISQPNVTFITSLGHRLYSVDFLRTLDSVTTDEDPPGGPSQRNRMEAFLEQCLGFDPQSLDGALVWDVLPFLSRPLLLATVDRLCDILRPGAHLLALFPTDEKATMLPVYSYRIVKADMVHLAHRGWRQPVEFFNNRAIERLFARFGSVKFFLTRDNLREVIVRR